MAGRRSRRSGTGARHAAVPDRLSPGSAHGQVWFITRRIALIGSFTLVSLLDAFWLLAFFITLISDPGGIGGSDGVIGFAVIQIVLTSFWIPLLRAIRRHRRFALRTNQTRRAGAGEFLPQVSVRPAPAGRHQPGYDPLADEHASRLSDREQFALSRAEQALGNVLYQLDLHRGSHQLTRAQIAALRVTGLNASARLATLADPLSSIWQGRTPSRQIADGIRRYADLAQETENFLVGRVSAAAVEQARDGLVQAIS